MESALQETEAKRRCGRVLVVESDPACGVLYARGVAHAGCQADNVSSVAQALERLRRHTYCLVLLDTELTDGHGSKVAHFLKTAKGAGQPAAIAISSDSSRGNRRRMLAAGAVLFMTKPVTMSDIVELVQQYCQASTQSNIPTEGPAL